MKRVNSIGVTAILVSTLIMGCDTNLDMSSIQHTPKLVVNSFVNSDELFSVQVSSTIPINDTNPPKMIENAIVTVNDGSTTATLVYDLSVQKYLATFKPYPGKVYSVRVEKGNFNTASGTLTIPNKVVSAKSIWKDKTGLDSSGFETGTLTCFIADASAERNYYEINLYRFDDITQEWLILPPTTIDPFLNENGIKTDIGGILIDDRSFNGSKKQFDFITSYRSAGTQYKFLVEVRSLSDDYYRYLQSLASYKAQSGIFSDPSPVYSNITNGRGICAGAAIQKDTIQ
ncbi:hypothetical protein LBMAG26_11940 [Bacteroidota bacterium]|nr:hypothetical protein LBMAG26_11940 [Bacteroidota bacterium]